MYKVVFRKCTGSFTYNETPFSEDIGYNYDNTIVYCDTYDKALEIKSKFLKDCTSDDSLYIEKVDEVLK